VAAHAALGEGAQRLGDQLRAEEGAADADIDTSVIGFSL